jgi:hypothetical protein
MGEPREKTAPHLLNHPSGPNIEKLPWSASKQNFAVKAYFFILGPGKAAGDPEPLTYSHTERAIF